MLMVGQMLQAELAWVREQLDRERSRSNGASLTNSAAHSEQRRARMELAQQAQLVSKLQGQVIGALNSGCI